jgi:hypothetical protein
MSKDYRPPKEQRTIKRGDCKNGLLFWTYSKHKVPNGEDWVSLEVFQGRLSKEKKRVRKDFRPPENLRTLKHGDINEDGKLFAGYFRDTYPNGERWITKKEFEDKKKERNAKNKKKRKTDNNWKQADRKKKREWFKNKYQTDESFRKNQIKQAKKWASNNPEKLKQKHKIEWEKIKSTPYLHAKKKLKGQKYSSEKWKNDLEFRKKHYKYQAEKAKNDPQYKMQRVLRQRIRFAIKAVNAKKKTRLNESLGCTPQFLVAYLEVRFKDGMTWQNHGKLWHLDHVKPLASFDLTKKSEQLLANHYTNLCPMWAHENQSKGKRIMAQQMLAI